MGLFLGRSLILLVGLFALPTLLGDFWAYQLGLYFLYSIAALGIGICWGRAGFLPLGQAMFLGIGAYLSGFALIHFQDSFWLLLLLPAAAVAPGPAAAVAAEAVDSPSSLVLVPRTSAAAAGRVEPGLPPGAPPP